MSPSPVIDEDSRNRVTSLAITTAKAVGYSNTGTVEFLRDSETGNFYFMEINSRLQVEHPVSELVTGIDLVETQIRNHFGKQDTLQPERCENQRICNGVQDTMPRTPYLISRRPPEQLITSHCLAAREYVWKLLFRKEWKSRLTTILL